MGEWWLFLLRWFHLLAGITWIGMLYYFNFVQTPFFAKADPPGPRGHDHRRPRWPARSGGFAGAPW